MFKMLATTFKTYRHVLRTNILGPQIAIPDTNLALQSCKTHTPQAASRLPARTHNKYSTLLPWLLQDTTYSKYYKSCNTDILLNKYYNSYSQRLVVCKPIISWEVYILELLVTHRVCVIFIAVYRNMDPEMCDRRCVLAKWSALSECTQHCAVLWDMPEHRAKGTEQVF